MRRVKSGGGWPAIRYALRMARQSGGLIAFYKALRTRNACKTCALGMGGQRGGMVDESGHFPEVCKKSMQAMAADMQSGISPEFFKHVGFDQLRQLSPRELEHLGRLTVPLLADADAPGYEAVSWDEALGHCADLLKNTQPDDNFFYVSGRSSNEAAFLLQLFARLYGTNQVNNCSYYCHQASGVGLGEALGTGTATVVLEDLAQCDLFVLIGGNPASNHPRLMTQLSKLRRRGGQVVVINPLVETGLVNFKVPSIVRSMLFGSKIASLYVQPHIGGDIAVLLGVAKRILELEAEDRGFLQAHTTGWDAVREHLESCSWDELCAASGVTKHDIDSIATLYAGARRVVFSWTMGITHHVHGVDNVHAIVNLALMRGMIGRRGSGMLPIRGHSNVQGIGSVGVTPKLKQVIFDKLQSDFGLQLPTSPGLDTLSCLEAMERGAIRNAWAVGGNLFGASPDATATARSFRGLDAMVYFSTTLNTGHAWGRARKTLILPMLARDEEAQFTTQESMFNFVRLSDGGARRHDGPRSEVEVVADLADRVLGSDGPIDWRQLRNHRNIRAMIAKVVPGYEQIEDIDANGAGEFQIAGRTVHEPRFPTADGKARLHVTPLPEHDLGPDQLRLMTIRSEGQFNTVVYEESDLYRHQERRDVILMSREDIERFGLRIDDTVTVRSDSGKMCGIRVREFDVRSGNAAMYFPEANVLVPTKSDPRSRTPAYKNVPITLQRETAPPLASVPLQVRRE